MPLIRSFRCNMRNPHSRWMIVLSSILIACLWRSIWLVDLEPDVTIPTPPQASLPGHDVNQTEKSSLAPPYWPKFGGARYVQLLDGMWNTAQVRTTNDLDYFDSMSQNFDPSVIRFNDTTNVPSCVDRSPPGYMEARGVFFFQRRFNFDLSTAGARIQFQACSFYCRVWINGKEIGDHRAGGYVAFFLDVPAQPSMGNEIFVLVDNRFNKSTAPVHTGGDFFHYGGIMRSVELHALPPPRAATKSAHMLWPWRLYVIPDSMKTIQVTLHLTSTEYTGPIDSMIKISFDGGPSMEYPAGKFVAVDGVASLGTLPVPNPRVWSTEDPQLHTIIVEMDGAILTERFGLRMFDVDSTTLRFRLNGEILKLVGWGHHTQWPDTAGSPTNEQLNDDILLLKAGGANFVRGAHYPQDPRWLDLLDEHGLVMWCETLGPNVSIADTQDEYFLRYQAQQMKEMLDNAMNHASIAFWAYFNEGPSQSLSACDAYRMNTDTIKSRDPSRLVSYASDRRPPGDKCFHGVADIMAMNGYPAWYDQNANPITYWNRMANYYRSVGMAFMISESGAGGIYEWDTNETATRWTCAYQSQVLAKDVEVALSNPNISGIALWHFFDFKVNDIFENNTHCQYLHSAYPPECSYINVTSTRPGGKNHKGVVDFWRRKKAGYDEVAKRFLNGTQRKRTIFVDSKT